MDTTERAEPQTVDINDSSLDFGVDELSGLDVEKDQFASMPVIPDGTYRVKLIHKQADGSYWLKKVTKKKKAYLNTQIECRVIDPAGNFDNWPIFDNQVSTLVMEMTGTNKIVGILKAIGVPTSELAQVARDPKELAKLLTDKLQGEPEVQITTQWEAYCETCEKTKVKGMKRFPAQKDAEGKPIKDKFSSQMECPIDGTALMVNPRIVKYLPADYVAKSQVA